MRRFLASVAVLLCVCLPANAQELFFKPVTVTSPVLTELRVGASFEGVQLNEDILFLPGVVPLDRLEKLSVEAIFGGVDLNVLNLVGSFRPAAGGTLALTGGDSWLWAGVNYHVEMLEPLWFELTLGGTVHNGLLDNPPPGKLAYGCRGLAYISGAFGVNLTENLTASVNLEHGSHARLCNGPNPGFNTVGFKLGYKF
jgi:hypothetical protein